MRHTSRWLRPAWLPVALVLAVTIPGRAEPPRGIQDLIAAGKLEGMRWPNFSDYQRWLEDLYRPTGYAPVWIQENQPSRQALSMIGVLKNAGQKGLDPEDYDASRWDDRVRALQGSAADIASFDLALTVCTMRYVSALRVGRINPKHMNFDLDVENKKYDLAQFLRDGVLPAPDLSAVLEAVEPTADAYRRAERALARYIELARVDDGEKLPEPSKTINPGQTYAGVPRLTRFLRLVGDLPANATLPADPQLYSGELVEAVRRFQRRHGLDDDGRLGRGTIKQLNVPLGERVRQLQLTLERWRWLPVEFPVPSIIVNIPDFRLRALDENNQVTLEMRVVAGKAMRTETPVFSRDMTYLVFRPYWNVPPSILRGEIVPAIERNRSYIADKGYEVIAPNGTIVTSGEISDDVLAKLKAGKLMVRQKPGPGNALGLVKLMFPNEYNIYLHSTPATQGFAHVRRDFSHGCIRVEKPAELAAWALRSTPGWPLERVQQAMENGPDDVTVRLVRPIPVYIVYGTALAYENDEVHFYDDIYGHDAALAEALAKGYPYP